MYATLQGIRKRAQAIQKHNDCPHLLSRGGYDLLEKKLLEEEEEEERIYNTCVVGKILGQ